MKIRPEKLRPMARLGGLSYARSIQSVSSFLVVDLDNQLELTLRRFCDLPRPSWEKVKADEAYQAAIGLGQGSSKM
jgi:hypothetical protein